MQQHLSKDLFWTLAECYYRTQSTALSSEKKIFLKKMVKSICFGTASKQWLHFHEICHRNTCTPSLSPPPLPHPSAYILGPLSFVSLSAVFIENCKDMFKVNNILTALGYCVNYVQSTKNRILWRFYIGISWLAQTTWEIQNNNLWSLGYYHLSKNMGYLARFGTICKI